MFGRRKRERAATLAIEGGSFMTIAQATAAVCSLHSDPAAAAKYLGNLLLGAMAAYGVGPDGTEDERHIWELVRANFGGSAMGESWQLVAALRLDINDALRMTELIAPPLMNTPRDQVQAASEGILCAMFGRSDPGALDVTERMICHVTGISLKTIVVDATSGLPEQMDDRVSIGAKIVTIYVILGARMEALRKARGGT